MEDVLNTGRRKVQVYIGKIRLLMYSYKGMGDELNSGDAFNWQRFYPLLAKRGYRGSGFSSGPLGFKLRLQEELDSAYAWSLADKQPKSKGQMRNDKRIEVARRFSNKGTIFDQLMEKPYYL